MVKKVHEVPGSPILMLHPPAPASWRLSNSLTGFSQNLNHPSEFRKCTGEIVPGTITSEIGADDQVVSTVRRGGPPV